MLISYSIDNGIYKHNLDDLSFNHLNHTTIKYKEVVGTGKNEITFDKVTSITQLIMLLKILY